MANGRDKAPTTLFDLPDELIQDIVSYVPLKTLVSLSATSRRTRRIADQPVIWRRLCRTEYRYWHPRHEISLRLGSVLAETDWKQLLATRASQDRFAKQTLDAIIGSQFKRATKLQEIVEYGYDVKEFLLCEHQLAGEYDDVLARRFWIGEILSGIEKSVALQTWTKLIDGEDVSLERALCAFDLFILQKAPESLDEISSHLDALAASVIETEPLFHEQTTRTKAMLVAAFMRSRDIGGVRSEESYSALQNTLISIALCESDHPAIPLVTVAIYCCIARRLGLDAHPWGGINHVMAIVMAEEGKTLDDHDLEEESRGEPQRMFLDPFRSSAEVPIQVIRATLSRIGMNSESTQNIHLEPSSTSDMVQRMARNLRSYTESAPKHHEVLLQRDPFIEHLPHFARDERVQSNKLSTDVSQDRARYAATWVLLVFTLAPSSNANPNIVRHALSNLFNQFEPQTIAFDLPLIEKYVLPQLALVLDDYSRQQLLRQLDLLKAQDDVPIAPQPRNNVETKKVTFSVGQTFTHARYHYTAAIVGWDTRCKSGESWISRMNVDKLPRGREQCFYHSVVDDESIRYVAEENIELITRTSRGADPSQPVQAISKLQHVAGRWFKRWDPGTGRYISNIMEQYPDD